MISLPNICAFSLRVGFWVVPASCLSISLKPDSLGNNTQEEGQHNGDQYQGSFPVIRLFRIRHNFSRRDNSRLPYSTYLTVGGVSKVWNGAGLGTVHSRPSAPSQGLSAAFSPPRIEGITTARMKYTCIRPKPNAPIEAIMLKSVNCAG